MLSIVFYCVLVVLALLAVALLGFAPVFPLTARQGRVSFFTDGLSTFPVVVNGTTAIGTGMTAMGDLAGVAVGALVTGTDIPASTFVVALDNAAHTVTLSQAATGVNTGNYSFFNQDANLTTNGASFRLYKADFTPTVDTVLANLTAIEADFDGYAARTLTMVLGYVDGTKTPFAESQLLRWIKSAGVNNNSVYGWWIDDGTNVIAAGKFSAIAPMTTTGAEISGVFQDGYPTGSGWRPLVPSNL